MNQQMSAKLNAKLNMFRTTGKHLDDNATIIEENVALQKAFNQFKANNTAIQIIAQEKSASLTGITADKANLKQTLCKLAATIAGAVSAYASATQNEILKQEMNLPVSTIMRSRDEALAPRCQMIRDRTAANAAALANYGIKPAQLTDLQTTAIDNYSAATMKPRRAVSSPKTANATLAALFKENDALLNDQIDKLIELYRADHSDFVQTY